MARHAPHRLQRAVAAREPAHAGALERVNVLVVDDRPKDLETLRLVLDDPGYEIVTARSGNEALRQLLVRDFAVVVLDVVLPGMGGFEIASLMKERERSRLTPIVFLTAAGGDMSFIYQAYQAGGVDYLGKPIDPRVLRAKIAIFAELFRKDRRILEQAAQLRDAERRRRRLELAELRRSTERRYRRLADAIPAIVWTARPDGDLDYTNRFWGAYTGRALSASRRAQWLDALHPDDRGAFEAGWREAVASRSAYAAECRVRRARDGEYRAHLCRAVPDLDGDANCLGWVATMTDTEDMRIAIQARDEFLAVASHELRTPLTTLALSLHGVRRVLAGRYDPAAVHKKLATAERQVARLDKLVGALLDVTRIAGHRPVVEPVECDLAALVREVTERLREEAERAGTELSVSTPEALPGSWDPLRLDQVLTNLLTNALRHGAGKGVAVTLERSADSARITVQDHGQGIPAVELPRLFQRFQRVSSPGIPGGLGLGLFISRQIAREHGGDIEVTSESGAGATFVVSLPIRAALRLAVRA